MIYLSKILELCKSQVIKTHYSHLNLILKSRRKFIFFVDCSGLIEFWLKKRYPSAVKEIYHFIHTRKKWILHPFRLFSTDFYDLFSALDKGYKSHNWCKRELSQKLETRDIIAFINPAKKSRCGHVAVVIKEILHTSTHIQIQVLDSSNLKHDEDWRQSYKNGIGTGVINIYLKDNAVDYICYYDNIPEQREVMVGRIINLNQNH